jgi:hypothetical protein
MKSAFILNLAKIVMLTLLIISLSNCRKDNKVCPEVTFDSTHFDNNEFAKIPDWKGDSLFFYSDAGDTAYMVCTEQYGDYKSYGTAAGSDVECGQRKFYYYPEYNYSYKSNHPDLNGIRVVIYKESNAYQISGGPPLSRINIPNIGGYRLSNLGIDSLMNDSVILWDGELVRGLLNGGENISLNLKFGILKLNSKNNNFWKLFKYNVIN